MWTFSDVEGLASTKRLVLEKRRMKDEDVTYNYSLYDNNLYVEDYFETLDKALSYIYHYKTEC